MKISNVQINGTSDRMSIACELDGYRYHIWFNPHTLKFFGDSDRLLYKVPLSRKRHRNDTRQLGINVPANRAIIDAMFAEAGKHNLIAEYQLQLIAEVMKVKDRQLAEHKLWLKQQAGPAMYEVLMMVVDDYDCGSFHMNGYTYEKAKKILHLAEHGKVK